MERYAPTIKDLAPRDMVSRAILTEINEGRGIDGKDYVYLDLRSVDKEIIGERLPEITTFCKIFMGIDPSEKPIPVLPTAHYAMGGIPTDIDGRVRSDERDGFVQGLYAAGECACVSVHGANRLGCNSLLDTVVFGRRAGMAIGSYIKDAERTWINRDRPDKAEGEIYALIKRSHDEKASDIRTEFQRIMMDKCSVFRNENDLKSLADEIKVLKERSERILINDKSKTFNTELLETIEIKHLIHLGEVIALSALRRQESRGAHFRDDFPKRDDDNWLKHTFAFRTDSGIGFKYRPATITRFKPEERKY